MQTYTVFDGLGKPPFPGVGMSANEAIEEIRRKAGLIKSSIALLPDLEDEESLSCTLSTNFRMWINNNGIFTESLTYRFSEAKDLTLLCVFLHKMERLQRLLPDPPDPLDDDPPPSTRCHDLQNGCHIVDSMHKIGRAMRTEFPSDPLVRKIRKMLSGEENNFDEMLSLSDICQAIHEAGMRFKPGELESRASIIYKDYRVVFATLVLLYKPTRIFGFMDEKISDDKLPLTEEFLVKDLKHLWWTHADALPFVVAQRMILRRRRELASEETEQKSPTTSVSSIPIPTSTPNPLLGSPTVFDQTERESIAFRTR